MDLRATCKRCRKQAVTTKEVREGVFHEECGSCGHKGHFRRDPAFEGIPRTSGRILETCDCG